MIFTVYVRCIWTVNDRCIVSSYIVIELLQLLTSQLSSLWLQLIIRNLRERCCVDNTLHRSTLTRQLLLQHHTLSVVQSVALIDSDTDTDSFIRNRKSKSKYSTTVGLRCTEQIPDHTRITHSSVDRIQLLEALAHWCRQHFLFGDLSPKAYPFLTFPIPPSLISRAGSLRRNPARGLRQRYKLHQWVWGYNKAAIYFETFWARKNASGASPSIQIREVWYFLGVFRFVQADMHNADMQNVCQFLPCDALRCTVFVIVILSVCLSVCTSVRLSVTLVDCVHMVRPTTMISSPYGSPIIQVSGDITVIPKFEGNHPERGRWIRVGWVRIGDFRPISRRISETVRDTTKVTINH